eukprot:47363-Chlamydomonas_euryale.AAC.2
MSACPGACPSSDHACIPMIGHACSVQIGRLCASMQHVMSALRKSTTRGQADIRAGRGGCPETPRPAHIQEGGGCPEHPFSTHTRGGGTSQNLSLIHISEPTRRS